MNKSNLNLYFDFEFTSLSPDAQPISLAVVSDTKKELISPAGIHPIGKFGYESKWVETIPSKSFYAEFSEFSIDRCDNWVKENVIKKLRFYPKVGDSNKDGLHSNASPFEVGGDFKHIKNSLKNWLSQFSDYNLQFVCDCGVFDWYWLLQLIGEWEESKMICPSCKSSEAMGEFNGFSNYCIYCETLATTNRIGLPKLPPNISPVTQDLNDLIAFRKGISIKEAFELNREEILVENVTNLKVTENSTLHGVKMQKHNSLWDAKVIKEIFNNLNKTL